MSAWLVLMECIKYLFPAEGMDHHWPEIGDQKDTKFASLDSKAPSKWGCVPWLPTEGTEEKPMLMPGCHVIDMAPPFHN